MHLLQRGRARAASEEVVEDEECEIQRTAGQRLARVMHYLEPKAALSVGSTLKVLVLLDEGTGAARPSLLQLCSAEFGQGELGNMQREVTGRVQEGVRGDEMNLVYSA